MKLLLGLNKDKGVTLIIVTHDPEIAEQTNRIVTIRDGRVEKAG
jgi:putative ABC transport system ATP-binding protein